MSKRAKRGLASIGRVSCPTRLPSARVALSNPRPCRCASRRMRKSQLARRRRLATGAHLGRGAAWRINEDSKLRTIGRCTPHTCACVGAGRPFPTKGGSVAVLGNTNLSQSVSRCTSAFLVEIRCPGRPLENTRPMSVGRSSPEKLSTESNPPSSAYRSHAPTATRQSALRRAAKRRHETGHSTATAEMRLARE